MIAEATKLTGFYNGSLTAFRRIKFGNYWSIAGPTSRPAVKASGTVGSYKSQLQGGSKLSCQRAQELIHPYIDEELERLQVSEFRQHLDQCKDCSLFYRNQLILHSALKQSSFYYRAPRDLHRRVRATLREDVNADASVGPAGQTVSGTAEKRR